MSFPNRISNAYPTTSRPSATMWAPPGTPQYFQPPATSAEAIEGNNANSAPISDRARSLGRQVSYLAIFETVIACIWVIIIIVWLIFYAISEDTEVSRSIEFTLVTFGLICVISFGGFSISLSKATRKIKKQVSLGSFLAAWAFFVFALSTYVVLFAFRALNQFEYSMSMSGILLTFLLRIYETIVFINFINELP